jgi:hypothetical protein
MYVPIEQQRNEETKEYIRFDNERNESNSFIKAACRFIRRLYLKTSITFNVKIVSRDQSDSDISDNQMEMPLNETSLDFSRFIEINFPQIINIPLFITRNYQSALGIASSSHKPLMVFLYNKHQPEELTESFLENTVYNANLTEVLVTSNIIIER